MYGYCVFACICLPLLHMYTAPPVQDMPTKWIFEPWAAPLDVQKKAKCIIGKDYPRPIVDHSSVRVVLSTCCGFYVVLCVCVHMYVHVCVCMCVCVHACVCVTTHMTSNNPHDLKQPT